MLRKSSLKDLLGEIPFTAEIYWHLRQSGKPIDPHFSLKHLEEHLADWTATARAAQAQATTGKKVAIFGVLRYWIEHTAGPHLGRPGAPPLPGIPALQPLEEVPEPV